MKSEDKVQKVDILIFEEMLARPAFEERGDHEPLLAVETQHDVHLC